MFTNTGDTQTTLEKNQGFMPAFVHAKAANAVANVKSTPPKFIFLVGGLAGSGKTSHLLPLINRLTEELALTVNYLDKDLIGRTMPGATSPQIYDVMMDRAVKAGEDVIIHEGNIIGNLGLFKDYIQSQHQLGFTIIGLDFQCADPKVQHARLVQRAEVDPDARQRDLKKLDFDYYVATDRPGEIARRDKQIALNQDLIDAGLLKLKIIETTTAPIEDNVTAILSFICALNPSVNAAHVSKRLEAFV